MTRRDLLATPLAAAAASSPALPPLCIFSKHLADLNYDELGRVAKDLGFDGVDLAVRPGGHVLPERAASDLPRAWEAIRAHGLSLPMITTGLLGPGDPAARPTLSTAARLRIPFYKSGYWRYKDVDVERRLAEVKEATRGLVELGKQYGVTLGMHNHSGDYFGAAVWDTRMVLEGLDPRWAGYYYDPAHATIEGGLYGWLLSLRLALPRLKMVAIKDFLWEKAAGRWRVQWVPLGEGMVNWPEFFAVLAKSGFQGPISLHLEYKAADEREAMAKDLAFLKKQRRIAYQKS